MSSLIKVSDAEALKRYREIEEECEFKLQAFQKWILECPKTYEKVKKIKEIVYEDLFQAYYDPKKKIPEADKTKWIINHFRRKRNVEPEDVERYEKVKELFMNI